ncbi:hypothetical protein GP486_007567 [Trichoglossum hirsutum]|uniref:P-loop containing nucleoside triphosphate hydrolase protein n=1 Tax=Trichoglossum hirsutum TaxID=265104 RepID=A0A9P8L6T0_9PEZI|nr:hypothetical protein GP486_007567 [Trichoglossum hirsutum]
MNASPPISEPEMPPNALDMLLPRHLSILKPFLKYINIEASVVVTICLSILALGTWLTLVWNHVYRQVSVWFMSSVIVNSDDELFECILAWLAEQNVTRNSRTLIARSRDSAGGYVVDSDTSNFKRSSAEVAMKYELSFGEHIFFYKRRLFLFHRDQRQGLGSPFRPGPAETVSLTCVGRSTQPIKELLTDAHARHLAKEEFLTTTRRPSPRHLRAGGGRLWSRIARRPSRPMDTVVLDPGKKAAVISDMEEYLLPTTEKWYANRGIPYRRGYLFYGPSGTGKTSFATALAGTFGIDIFVVSLLEPTLTEEDLLPLFSDLPHQCIVLLEDVDSAGLARNATRKTENDFREFSYLGTDVTRVQGISMSGLLNAIDGVASHEGRILVMTTNYPEKLDEALLRPGRIDMQIEFSMATRPQAQELFMRMYAHDETQTDLTLRAKTADGESGEEVIGRGDLEDMASKFAQLIPDHEFTPAEIQGFLLTKKNDPKRALAEVQEWGNMMMIAKGRVAALAGGSGDAPLGRSA